MRADVSVLEQSFEPTDTATTRVILRTGLLASNGLMHDARKQVIEALAATPDDPALYTLLGALYERTGLRQQAATAYQEAQILMDAGGPAAPLRAEAAERARPARLFRAPEGVLF